MNRRSFLYTLPIAGAAVGQAPPSDKPTLRLGIIADPQYADKDTAGSRHYRASLGKLRDCIAELNKQPLDAVVTLGDFIDVDINSFTPVLKIYNELKAPHFKVVGNHDFSVDAASKGKVLYTLGMEKSYFSKDIGGYRIIVLDGTDFSPFRPENAEAAKKWMKELRAEGRKNIRGFNGGIGETQLKWLEEELKAATKAGARAILCCHYPAFPADGHNLWNDLELNALIDQFPCVAAWFNGHNHRGNYATRKHCHYVNFKGMVETADQSAYAIASCYNDRIEIEGFDTEPSRNLELPKLGSMPTPGAS